MSDPITHAEAEVALLRAKANALNLVGWALFVTPVLVAIRLFQ